jgi:cellulase/cellobiase CelA1
MSKAKSSSVRQGTRKWWRCFGVTCIGLATSAACNPDYQSDESTPAVQALASQGISVSLTYQSDWKSGYCSRVLVTNTGNESLQDWQIVINLGQARLTQVNNANSNLVGARMTVTSPIRNARIAAGDSTSFDFCANAGGRDYHPTLESVAFPNRPGFQKG